MVVLWWGGFNSSLSLFCAINEEEECAGGSLDSTWALSKIAHIFTMSAEVLQGFSSSDKFGGSHQPALYA